MYNSPDIAAIKAELDKFVNENLPDIRQIKEGSETRILADILEKEVPGRGVELVVKICEQLGGGPSYLMAVNTLLILIRNQWIRDCGYSKRILRQVTGLSHTALNNIESVDFEQLRLPGIGSNNNDTLRKRAR